LQRGREHLFDFSFIQQTAAANNAHALGSGPNWRNFRRGFGEQIGELSAREDRCTAECRSVGDANFRQRLRECARDDVPQKNPSAVHFDFRCEGPGSGVAGRAENSNNGGAESAE
jgi:hypothetical protein